MLQVYGFKLVQVESRSGVQYIVVLDEECKSLPSTAANAQHKQLLIAALTHIFMTGGPVKDGNLQNIIILLLVSLGFSYIILF